MLSTPLQVGSQIRCPHCRRWHAIVQRHTEGTEYTQRMLYWECRGSCTTQGRLAHQVDMRRASHTHPLAKLRDQRL
jgi:hypothetical protein